MAIHLPGTRVRPSTVVTTLAAGLAAVLLILVAVQVSGDSDTASSDAPIVAELSAEQLRSAVFIPEARNFRLRAQTEPQVQAGVTDVDPRIVGVPVITIGPGRPDQLLTITPSASEFPQLIGPAGFLTRS